MARSAGVPCLLASSGGDSKGSMFAYGQSLAKGSANREHALRRSNPYAVVTPAGWIPVEASVMPHSGVVGAGVVSAGSIDNTYMAPPLQNGWGKKREFMKNEVRKPPIKQSTDLCVVAKGGIMPPPPMRETDMSTIRPTYSAPIQVFHGVDPMRSDCGFVRGPNIIPGAKPPPQAPWNSSQKYANIPSDWKLRKLAYDQAAGGSRIPVSRIIHSTAQKPSSAQQKFLAKAAGMPGGLAIIDQARPMTAA
eukprot:CAMPEP_0115873736 /NCGR_PEP_ID=MMETSP0287-20121206/24154_1 /TAXON_ID=412157 /ORGANISM="Chrysochromulina rotalis, Strain UIO044" /LENGTH=248 /DNA_ID=CAMNT_0003328815 /DNA_START=43 /DNA_END=789 /DNA_ORIENTATION=+